MKTKRILLAIVCLIVIFGGLNYLLQQSPMPIGTPESRLPIPQPPLTGDPRGV